MGAAQTAYNSGELIFNNTGGSGTPTLNSLGLGFWGASNQFIVYPSGICNAAAYFSSAVKPCTAYYLTSNTTVAAGGTALLTSSAIGLTVDSSNNALGNSLISWSSNSFTNVSGRVLWASVTYQVLWDNTVNVNAKAAFLQTNAGTEIYAYTEKYDTNVLNFLNGAAIMKVNVGSAISWWARQNTTFALDVVASFVIPGFGGSAVVKTRIAIEILN